MDLYKIDINIKCGRCHDHGCGQWGLNCLDGTYNETKPEFLPQPQNYYGVFVMYTEDEGNIVYEFASLCNNLDNSKQIIKILSEKYTDIKPTHKEINPETDFTYIGNRNDLDLKSSRGFGSINGFVIEQLKINNICNNV